MTRYKETLKPELTLSSLFVCFTQLKMTSAWSGFPHSRAGWAVSVVVWVCSVRCEVSTWQDVPAGPGNSEELRDSSPPHCQSVPISPNTRQTFPAGRGCPGQTVWSRVKCNYSVYRTRELQSWPPPTPSTPPLWRRGWSPRLTPGPRSTSLPPDWATSPLVPPRSTLSLVPSCPPSQVQPVLHYHWSTPLQILSSHWWNSAMVMPMSMPYCLNNFQCVIMAETINCRHR